MVALERAECAALTTYRTTGVASFTYIELRERNWIRFGDVRKRMRLFL